MNGRSICALAILIGGVWVTAAKGQSDTPAPAKAEAPGEVGRIKAQLLLIRWDWTGDDGVEGAEGILQSLLQNVPVPKSYSSLAANAPRMLFPVELLSIYDPAELATSIVWLGDRNLIRIAGETTPLDDSDEDDVVDGSLGSSDARTYVCSIFVDAKTLPPPGSLITTQEAPPYVHRVIGTELQFRSSLEIDDDGAATGITVLASRTRQMRDEIKNSAGETASTNISSWGSERFSFDVPLDKVAVFPFHHMSRQNAQGHDEWYPIVIITPAALDIPEPRSAALSKPSALTKIREVGNRSRSRGGGTRTSPVPTRANESPANEIKVFALQNARAASAVEFLTQLLAQGKFVADERTNSVIATGTASELKIAEALLLQLDRPSAESPEGSPVRGTRDRPSLEEFLRRLRTQYSTREEQARSVSQSLAAEKDAEAAQRLRESLKIAVTESFGLRQELQKAELELLRERIRGIETQLRQRENLRDAIIKHRVEQLASGEPPSRSPSSTSSRIKPRGGINVKGDKVELMFTQLSWQQVLQAYADVSGVALQVEDMPPGTFSYYSPRPHTFDEAREVLATGMPAGFELVQNEGQLIVRRLDLPAASHLSASGVTTLRGPEEYRRTAEAVNEEIEQLEALRHALQQQGQPGTQYDKALTKLRQRLALLRDEYAAQIRLLELEIQAADAGLKTAQRALKRMTAMFEGGHAASTEMDQATLSHEQAKVWREKAQTLLDLYLKAGAATELLKPATEPGKAADGQPPTASTRSPTTNSGNAVVWVEAIVPSEENPDENEAVYGNGVVVSANGLIVVTLGRELSRLPKDEREKFRATVKVPNVKREDARIVLLDEKSSLALLKVDAGDWPYLTCHSRSLALGQQLTVVSRGGANHTPASDEAAVAAIVDATNTDVPGAVIHLNRSFPRVYSGAATLSTGSRLAGFLAIPPDGQQGLVVPAARVVELLTIYHRALAVEEADDAAANDTGHGGVSIEALPEEGVLILRGSQDSVQRVIGVLDQIENSGSEPNPQPAEASRNASPE